MTPGFTRLMRRKFGMDPYFALFMERRYPRWARFEQHLWRLLRVSQPVWGKVYHEPASTVATQVHSGRYWQLWDLGSRNSRDISHPVALEILAEKPD